MNFWCTLNLVLGLVNLVLAFLPPPFAPVNLVVGVINLFIAWVCYDS
jgi:hypothetical protein